MRLIEKVIECTDKPGIYPVEESCSNLAMGFWYMLQVCNNYRRSFVFVNNII